MRWVFSFRELQIATNSFNYGNKIVEGPLEKRCVPIVCSHQGGVKVVHRVATSYVSGHDVSNAVDEFLSKVPAGLTGDGIQLVKSRVLESARSFFDTTFTSYKVEVFKWLELVAELHMSLACRVQEWISRNTISVATFSILHCSGYCGPFIGDGHYVTELSKYMSRYVKSLNKMP